MADDPYAALGTPIDAAPAANNGTVRRPPQPGRKYSIEDAIQELGMTAPEAQQFVAGQSGAAAAPAPQGTASDPYSQIASPEEGGAQVVDTSQSELVRGDQAPPQVRAKLTPDDEGELVRILTKEPLDAAGSKARAFLASKGFDAGASTDPHFPDKIAQVLDYRAKHGVVNKAIEYDFPKPDASVNLDAGAAGVRGMGDAATAGLVNHIDAGLHALVDEATGKAPNGIVDAFERHEDVNQGILQADEANHPEARLVGQLLGSLAIPTGMEGAALNAGKSVLRAGGTLREARAAAAAAARSRIAKEAGAYGAVHGAADAQPGNRIEGAITGATVGAVTGHALTAAGQAAAPAIRMVRKALGPAGDPAVDAAGELAASQVPDTPPSSPDYVELARNLGIRRTPATNSRTGVATVIQSGLGALPGGSPIGHAANREIGDLANAARDIAAKVGPISNPKGAGDAISEGAAAYKAASKAQANAMYSARDALIGGSNAPVPTDSTAAAMADISSRFPTSPAVQQLREHPAIRAVADALPGEGKQPLTLGEATEALSHVRGVVRNLSEQGLNGKATAPVLARVKQVEQGLEDDVMAAARGADVEAGRAPGSPGSAVAAQREADAFYADRAAALNGALKRPLQSAKDDTKVSGESVYNQLAGDMHEEGGNLARLRATWFRLPDKAKRVFAATRIDDLGRANPGQQNADRTAWSFQTFLTNVNKLSPQARKIVFGADADGQLQQVAQYASRLRDLDRARNFSNSAQKWFAGAFVATIGGAVLHGDVSGALHGMIELPAAWGGAKLLLSTPAMRDWTTKALKAAAEGNETVARVLTKKLGTIASTQPTLASEVLGLQRALERAANDNMVARMAASPNAGGPHEQKRQKAVTP